MGERRILLGWLCVAAVVCLVPATVVGAESGVPSGTTEAGVTATHHTITVDGKRLSYVAETGFITIQGYDGKAGAPVFYIAYAKEKASPADRPLTFLFNGGPGVASMFLHLGAFGPKVLPRSPDGTQLLAPPYSVVTNPNTLLDVSDLVFIDPVGTGFGEVPEEADPSQFWGVKEDVRAVGEFIRAYVTQNGRWTSPVFIAGESYGGVRGAGLAEHLQDLGIYPRGLVLISPVFDLGTIQWSSMGDRALALTIPAYAAAAWYHKKIARRLQGDLDATLDEVRQWSRTEYLQALWQGHALPPEEKTEVASRLAEYIGVSAEVLERRNLRLYEDDFATELLRAEDRSISIYDARLTALGPYTGDANDQSMFNYAGPLKACINDYFRRELNCVIDRPYLSGSAEVYLSWNWQSGRSAPRSPDALNLGYPDITGLLAQAVNRCEFLKVFIASGIFDLECPYESVMYSVNHLDLPPERLRNIRVVTYPGGHMLYFNPEAHKRLKTDLAGFYAEALSEGNGAGPTGQ